MSMRILSNNERMSLRSVGLTFCPRCEKVVELLTFDEAASAYSTDLQDITWLAEYGDLHKLHDRRAELMICSLSLWAVFEKRRTRLLVSSVGITAHAQVS